MTDVRLRIWDGPPGAGGTVIWGDTTTNRLSATGWTNIYRVTETTTGVATDRPIMYNIAAVNTFLPAGTYWLDWQANGTLGSGPWAPPITITGQATTGNGVQSLDSGVSYAPLIDTGSGTVQGLPFVIEGSVGPVAIASISLDKTVAVFGSGCPGSDSISVTPGTQVEYCYEVTNTGTVTLTVHDLVDDQLGTLFTGFNYALGPGMTAGAGVGPVTINSTTPNSATWTAYNPGPVDVASDTDTATVYVGADSLVCNGAPVTFESGIPGSFTTLVTTGPVYWSTTDDLAACDNGGNQTLGSGEAACADSDETNAGGVPYDTEMWTNPIDLTGLATAQLEFLAAYNDIGTADLFDVDVSTNAGSTWSTILSWNEDHDEAVTLDLSAYVGNPAVLIRFHYYGTGWDWWVQVDDVGLQCGTFDIWMPVILREP
jgi:hypothetical protein